MGYKIRTPKDAQCIMNMQVVKFNHGKCIVRIDNNAYLTDGEGDPPRAVLKENAKVFSNRDDAENAIVEAIKTHPSRCVEYKVEELNIVETIR